MTFYYHANKTHFHKKGFALGLVLRVRVFGIRKWPIHDGMMTLILVVEVFLLTLHKVLKVRTILSPHFEPSACGTTLLTQDEPPFVQYKEPHDD